MVEAAPDVADAGITCTGSLPDAGFSSLADFPIAQICAQAEESFGYVSMQEATVPCDGSILVRLEEGADSDSFWIFDASTGALLALGGGADITELCTGSVPGFHYPNGCWQGAFAEGPELCPAARDGGGIVEASADRASDTGPEALGD